MSISLIFIPLLDWAHECHEFSWYNPVEIAIFYSLIVFVFFDVECSEIVPAEFDCVLQALKALKKSTIVETVSLRGISVMLKQFDVATEFSMSLLSGVLFNDDHEGSHKESAIDHFVWLFTRAIVEHSIVRVILVLEKSGELS